MTIKTELNVSAKTIKGFEALVKADSTKDKLEGFLLFEGVAKKDAIAFLKEQGIIGVRTFRDWMYAECTKGSLSDEDFGTEIEKQSGNVLKHRGHYDQIRLVMNTIWAAK